jgi:hypothetical protein
MRLVKTLTQTFKKGQIYNFAEGDDLIPKYEYKEYFENSDEGDLPEGGEWCAEDRCIKSFKIITKLYS